MDFFSLDIYLPVLTGFVLAKLGNKKPVKKDKAEAGPSAQLVCGLAAQDRPGSEILKTQTLI